MPSSFIVFLRYLRVHNYHYGKNVSCRATRLCRPPAARQRRLAVQAADDARHRNAPRQQTRKADGKANLHGKTKENARQRKTHGNDPRRCRALLLCRELGRPARHEILCRAFATLPCAILIFFSISIIVFILTLIFIFKISFTFVDY